ncbi:hypothetical protein MKW98_005769 [Papaver atlanticum]|uniref:RNase H type-1 domain-containing protein n=1 Tax=Papaver atlanticum TaxID=357466 RepID=A0AAD4RZE9_9MAGN|nr:hypothetical protein MKW98_005769 [Papaver atlanticum]
MNHLQGCRAFWSNEQFAKGASGHFSPVLDDDTIQEVLVAFQCHSMYKKGVDDSLRVELFTRWACFLSAAQISFFFSRCGLVMELQRSHGATAEVLLALQNGFASRASTGLPSAVPEDATRLYFGEHDIEGMLNVLEPLHERLKERANTVKEQTFIQRRAERIFRMYVYDPEALTILLGFETLNYSDPSKLVSRVWCNEFEVLLCQMPYQPCRLYHISLEGKLVEAWTMVERVRDVTQAEAVAALKALQWITQLQLQHVIVEGDTKKVMDSINGLHNISPWEDGNLIRECQHLIQCLGDVVVCFKSRKCNQVADLLTRYARNNNCSRKWVVDLPVCVSSKLESERLSCNT